MWEKISMKVRRDLIGLVPIDGVIFESRTIIDEIRRFRQSSHVKAVILRINSPGGSVAPAQEIYEAIRETSKIKKVVASLASMAASGGYYIASAADRVFANPGTITGSIGVVMRHSNVDELYRKIGLSTSVIKSGEYKDLGSSFRNITPREERLFQGLLDTVHGQFIDAVAAGRGMEREKVAGLADGRIFTGADARDMGLVDDLGGFQAALQETGRMIGIEEEPRVITLKRRKNALLEYLFGSAVGSSVQADLLGAGEPLLYLAMV